MKAQTEHRFEVSHLDDPNAFSILQFCHKEPLDDGTYKIVVDGTTNEEVLRALLSRLKAQHVKGPNDYTLNAINSLREAGKSLQAYYESRKPKTEENAN